VGELRRRSLLEVSIDPGEVLRQERKTKWDSLPLKVLPTHTLRPSTVARVGDDRGERTRDRSDCIASWTGVRLVGRRIHWNRREAFLEAGTVVKSGRLWNEDTAESAGIGRGSSIKSRSFFLDCLAHFICHLDGERGF